ncbi:copper chaperone PCu(A)C [Jannaschia formosa]|uniref:copper chaperone PCu(A)C n=1 Tax=Jannaschia formosa TaxID=2259592 RepID=UPI000E1B945D|nr:copper chaperone PCu(A)C [Jannaschia formosa]TFL18104.1 copper chaperone PCu(A)C [Jannaschia formosa]
MKTTILTALLLAATSLAAVAHDYTLGDLTIGHPFAFATPPNAPVAGGYLTITNAGTADDRLVAVRAAPEVAGMIQIHEMRMDGEVMRMSETEGGLPLPAGETVTLEQGGLHLMFMQLPAGFEEGATIPATLVFERAGEVEVDFAVEPRGGSREGHHHSD